MMDGVITGETDDLLGLSVIDNNDVEHVIDIRKSDGEITAHNQDGYPDKAAERNDIENEHVNQARRFAKFYVSRERDYDTLEPRRNPDRIAAVTLALGSLSPDSLVEYLDAYYQQLNHYQLGTEPVVETPEISDSALIWLDQDISVSLGEETTAQLNETLSSHGVLDALEESSAGGEDLQRSVQQALTDHDIDTASVGDAIGTTLLEAVGPLEINYRQGGQTSSTTAPGTGSPLGETADARLQLFADLYEETTPEGFQRAVVHHLRCQIRDCYVRCGIAPPEDVRIQGPGFYENVSWYEHLGFYEPYNDPRQTVDTWLEEHTPDDLLV